MVFGQGTDVELPIPSIPKEEEELAQVSSEEKAARRRLEVERAVAPISAPVEPHSSFTKLPVVVADTPYTMPPIPLSNIAPPLFDNETNQFYPATKEALIEIFNRFDVDSDNFLSHLEFSKLCQSVDLHIFHQLYPK